MKMEILVIIYKILGMSVKKVGLTVAMVRGLFLRKHLQKTPVQNCLGMYDNHPVTICQFWPGVFCKQEKKEEDEPTYWSER